MSESFFVSCALGHEEALGKELRETWPWLLSLDGRFQVGEVPEFMITKGGIEFTAELHLGLQLNFFLKIANRVLLRLSSFKCRDFPKLFSKFEHGTKLRNSLERFVDPKKLQLEVAASESRLNNEKRISETIIKALGIVANNSTENGLPTLYVRANQDDFTISLDTSGDHLHMRSSPVRDKWVGEAPLRETLAAFCLQCLIGDAAWPELRKITLIDPMAGSGTLLVEAARMHLLQHRHFAFQDWKAVPKALSLKTFFHALDEKRITDRGGLWGQLIGCDSDKKAVESMQHNISSLGLVNPPSIHQEDVFELLKIDTNVERTTGPKWLILNAPYGERLKWTHSSEELCAALFAKWKPERIGILWSEAQAKSAPKKIQGLGLSETHNFKNGGIPVSFQIWKK